MMSSSASALDTILSLTFELSRVIRHRMLCVAKEGHPINFLQIHTLALIESRKGITMKELADAMLVTPASATSFVQRLVKQHYVQRVRDPKNRKLVRLQITEAGRKVLGEKHAGRREAMRQILGILSADEQKQLASILDHLMQSLHSEQSA